MLLQRLEEPLEAGSVGVPGDGVAQRVPAAVPEERLWDVGLYQGCRVRCVLRVLRLQNRRLHPPKKEKVKNRSATIPNVHPLILISQGVSRPQGKAARGSPAS